MLNRRLNHNLSQTIIFISLLGFPFCSYPQTLKIKIIERPQEYSDSTIFSIGRNWKAYFPLLGKSGYSGVSGEIVVPQNPRIYLLKKGNFISILDLSKMDKTSVDKRVWIQVLDMDDFVNAQLPLVKSLLTENFEYEMIIDGLHRLNEVLKETELDSIKGDRTKFIKSVTSRWDLDFEWMSKPAQKRIVTRYLDELFSGL